MELIVTHSGHAHFDEVLAISLLTAVHAGTDFRIERHDPTTAELDDPRVWVVDAGGRHEPEKRNFDHHQALECPASFVLIAEHLGLLETMSVESWWDFKNSMDRVGPVKTAELFEAGDYLVNRSPVEGWLMAMFGAEPQSTLPLLKSLGFHVINEALRLKRQVDFWKTSTRLTIAGIPAVLGETTDSTGLEEFRRLHRNPPGIVITLDGQGQGWRFSRFEGVPVDFTLISDRPEIAFAHKSGFLAKTRERLPVASLVSLLSEAVVNGAR